MDLKMEIKTNALAVYLFEELVKDLNIPEDVVKERRQLTLDRAALFLDIIENGDVADNVSLVYTILTRNGYDIEGKMPSPKETNAIQLMRKKVENYAERTRSAVLNDALKAISRAMELVNCKLAISVQSNQYVFLTLEGKDVLYEEVTPDVECFVWRLGNAVYEQIGDALFKDVRKRNYDKYCAELSADIQEYKDEMDDFFLAVAYIGDTATKRGDTKLCEKYGDYFNLCISLSNPLVLELLTLEEIRQGILRP